MFIILYGNHKISTKNKIRNDSHSIRFYKYISNKGILKSFKELLSTMEKVYRKHPTLLKDGVIPNMRGVL